MGKMITDWSKTSNMCLELTPVFAYFFEKFVKNILKYIPAQQYKLHGLMNFVTKGIIGLPLAECTLSLALKVSRELGYLPPASNSCYLISIMVSQVPSESTPPK